MGVFSVNTGITLRVQNLTIANGRAAEGGGIWNSGTVTVSNSTFAGNSAITGGGIYNPFDGILTLTNCTLSGNSAGYGGAIANEGTVTLANSALSGNSASVSGGAITNFNTATLTDCALSGNSASGMGGAIVNISLSLTLTNCTLNGNAAGTGDPLNGAGGAIFNLNGTLTLTNSTLSGNSAPRGGGMANACVSPVGCGFDSVVVNSTFSGNHADAGAGAIDGPLQTSVTNSIIANSGGANCGNGGYPAAITDGGHNLQWPGTGCGNTIPSLDPMLDPGGLRDNGGPTQTIALLPNSPVINAGDEAVCAAAPVNGLDQRGYVRPGTGATRCSIGAYEFDSPGPPPCDGDCNNDGHVTIDELLTLANIALGGAQPAACSHGVPSGIEVGIALILQAVNNALTGCGG